ncbi:hypothetical protein [Variovorax sp. WS11]|uniref:hypothetical protein n=1 Tax=Variovorax sp. WS11 TaxID=1105204 RepID=UPI0011B270FA|nr:hypothetical protein [Variovorax sp. WS11]NDZ12777.1 hypothetical protein [Variovorax sp. WS11]
MTVLPDLNLADCMTAGERDAAHQSNRIAAQQLLAHELRVAQNVDRTSDVCGMLDAAVRAYDSEARQPLSALRQDRLRQLRKDARDRQFALRCQ